MRKLLALLCLLPVSISAGAAVDGLNIKEDFCPGGTPGCTSLVQVQRNHTAFGDTYAAIGNYTPGSELDQLYVFKTDNELAINITGNIENNGNGWVIFLDTVPGGENVLDANAGPGHLTGMEGNQFDPGFEPDYAVVINSASNPPTAYIDLVNLQTNSAVYLGNVAVNGTAPLAGGTNPNNSQAAFNGSNNVGVTSDAAKNAAQHKLDAATAQKGLELRLNFADIGLLPGVQTVKVMAVLTGGGGYLSNQILPGLASETAQFANLGDGPTNFASETVAPGQQYATVNLLLQNGGLVDGDNIPQDSGSNTLVATQNNYTGFGNGSGGGSPASNGSELDALFLRNTSSALEMGITGNLEANQNFLVIFLQTGLDGVPSTGLSAPEGSGPPPDLFPAMNGTQFDTGFNPTHAITVNSFNVEEPEGSGTFVTYAFVDLYDLRSNTGRYLGRVQVGSGLSALTGGSNPNGLQLAFSNANQAGVTDNNNKTVAQNEADALTANTGFELVIPFKDIGLTTTQIKYLVAITGRTAYFSNQLLPGLNGQFGNLGSSPVNFNTTPGLQYGVYDITGTIPVQQFADVTALKQAFDGTKAQLTSTVSAVFSDEDEFYIEDSWPRNYQGILVSGLSGLVQPGQSVTVEGYLGRKGGERALIATSVVAGGDGSAVKPLQIVQKNLGGAALGQTPGITGGVGLNNVGLLVQVAGTVTGSGFEDDGSQYFYLDDGSNLLDGNILLLPGVRVDMPSTAFAVPETGKFARVIGVSSVVALDGTVSPRIRLRSDEDVEQVN